MSASPALVTLVGLPTVFRLEFGKSASGTGLSTTTHPGHDQLRGAQPGLGLAPAGTAQRGHHPITCERKGLLGSFHGEGRGLNPSCARCAFFPRQAGSTPGALGHQHQRPDSRHSSSQGPF